MELVKRDAVRALIIDPNKNILLMKVSNPSSSWEGWIAPGGGIEKGETHIEALLRELSEELGLSKYNVLAPVWNRYSEFEWAGRLIGQSEMYYLLEVDWFLPQSNMDPSETELLGFLGFKWWGLEELKASNERFAPLKMPELLEKLFLDGPPSTPIDVGV